MSYKRLKSIQESIEEVEEKPSGSEVPSSSVEKDPEKKEKSYVKSVMNKFEDHYLLRTSENKEAMKQRPLSFIQSRSLPSSPLKENQEFFDEQSDSMLLVEHEETEYGPGLTR